MIEAKKAIHRERLIFEAPIEAPKDMHLLAPLAGWHRTTIRPELPA